MIKMSSRVDPSRLVDAKARQARLREIIENGHHSTARPTNETGHHSTTRPTDETAHHSTTRPTNENVFQRKLESHLFDVKMRNPWRTPSVHSELKSRHLDNRDVLADIDPEAMRMYVGLISGMGYRQQARLASSVFQMSKNLEQLSSVDERLAKIRPLTLSELAQASTDKASKSELD